MSTKIDPVSTIVASFPIPELSKLGDATVKPTYHALLTVQKELNTNAASIDTTQGSGLHGLLVLTMNPTEFDQMINPPNDANANANNDNNNDDDDDDDAAIIRITHPPPANPGPLNPIATVAAARTHAEAVYHHQTYHSTDKALKKILLESCPDLYLSAIKHPRTGYATVTTRQMLQHLWTTYGEITSADLDTNLTNLSKPWHPTTPIETLFLQIDDGLDFALAGESPIDNNTAVRITYNILFATGLFELACREWRAKPKQEKTLANLKVFFTIANNDRAATTSTAGYHNHAANTTFTTNDTLTALLAAHNHLQKTVERLEKAASKPAPTSINPTFQQPSNNGRPPPTVKGYCHTHGHTCVHNPAKIHTSATCRNPGPTHNNSATALNTMNGSTKVWTPPQPPTN